jgi:hypothetical protein
MPRAPRLLRALLLAGVVLAGAGTDAARAGVVDTPLCQRDLLMTDAALRKTMELLQGAGTDPANQCRVWRGHVGTLRKARDVFARCTTGRERAENVGQMEGSAADFEELIRQRCKGR